jgi:2-amino-4-hydroxy-6-hydroxymethyldihydropteridine diphosphokinase
LLAYIGLGSNLKGPKEQIERALKVLSEAKETTLLSVSSFYQSKPLLDMPGLNYLNVVCKIETDLSALDLLNFCQEIEDNQHRVRGVKWGSRTIDLDILVYGEQVLATKRLTVPHPEMINRAFVLLPLFEIEPGLKLPLLGPLKGLLERIQPSDVEKL